MQDIKTYKNAYPVCFSIPPTSIVNDLINIIRAPNREITHIITAAMNRYENATDRESLIVLPFNLIIHFNYRVIPDNLQLLLVWSGSKPALKPVLRFGGLAPEF